MHPSNLSGNIQNTKILRLSKKQQRVVGDVLYQLVVFGLHYLSLTNQKLFKNMEIIE